MDGEIVLVRTMPKIWIEDGFAFLSATSGGVTATRACPINIAMQCNRETDRLLKEWFASNKVVDFRG